MLFSPLVCFTFYLRTSHQNRERKHPIVLRIKLRGERKDLFTGLFCAQEAWCRERRRLHPRDQPAVLQNQQLEFILRGANKVWDTLSYAEQDVNLQELGERIRQRQRGPLTLEQYLQGQQQKFARRYAAGMSLHAYTNYRRTADVLSAYLAGLPRGRSLPLSRVDEVFLERFFLHLRTERSVSYNVSVRYMRQLKVLLQPAIRAGLTLEDPFRYFPLKQRPVKKAFLTDEELEKIIGLPLSQELDRVRKQFLFCCFTGLSYSDLTSLKKEEILRDQTEGFYISKDRRKTSRNCVVPLLPAAIRILTFFSPTNDFRDFHWRISSNQKMNLRLKKIGEKAGLQKSLHMHLARHTFATTITLANGVPIETICRMLGHASIRHTQLYAQVMTPKIRGDMQPLMNRY